MMIDAPSRRSGFRFLSWKSGQRPTVVMKEECVFLFVEAGRLKMSAGRSHVRLAAGDWCVGHGAMWDQVEISPSSVAVGVAMPVDWISATRLSRAFVSTLLSGAILVRNNEPSALRIARAEWSAAAGPGGDPEFAAFLLELEAWLLRFEYGLPVAQLHPEGERSGKRLPAGDSEGRERVAAMTDFLATHFAEAPSVGEVCRAARLPAAYGAALFKKATGATIREHLDRLRFAEARRRLALTDERVIDVAMACGFKTQSRFYEAFTRAFGLAPAAYRERVRALREPGSAVRGFVGGAGRLRREGGGDMDEPSFPLVLWVDDRPANNWEERLFLHELGVFSDCHTENASALAAMEQAGHDLVISDIWRDGETDTGWDLLAELRRRGAKTPVLFYTGNAGAELQKRAASLGAQGVFDRSRPLIEAVLTLLAAKPVKRAGG